MQVTVVDSAEIDAPAARVYGLIADYRDGHPRIVPRRWFGPITVEEGGTGAGTVIAFDFRAGGVTTRMRGRVTEPEPGRRLAETYENGSETSFLVEPIGADRCRVEIRSTWTPRGLRGLLERAFVPALLKKVFRAELEQLRGVVAS